MCRKIVCALALLALSTSNAPAESTKLVDKGSSDWKYFDASAKAPENWHGSDFDDSEWKSGQSPLGYGDDDIKQTISFGDDDGNKRLCAFFRHSFEVEDPAKIKAIIATIVCDDGCAIYVNGKEVHRHNLPEGELKETTMAPEVIHSELERHGLTAVLDSGNLTAGKNIVAVRVHQRGPESSDMALDVELRGEDDEEAIEEAKQTEKAESEQLEQFFLNQ